jgi:hypothetical protein
MLISPVKKHENMNYYHFLKNILIIYSGNNSPMESDLEGSLCNCKQTYSVHEMSGLKTIKTRPRKIPMIPVNLYWLLSGRWIDWPTMINTPLRIKDRPRNIKYKSY